MSSTQKSYSSLLSVDDIMENGFLMSSSSYSPSNSCFLEMNSISRSDSTSNTENVKGSLVALKTSETSLNNGKCDLQVSCDGVGFFCKTPVQPCTFDLSNLSSANNSTASSMADAFCDTKSSTPCKEEKLSKQAENALLRSSDMNDLSVFKKPLPPPVLEISGIQANLDNTLSLEASLEELGSLAAVKPDTLSLEASRTAIPLASSGVAAAKPPVLPV
ncbi:uncharacterized protein LOC132566179 [Heteronotia binoei]|uniref:uncharacterized protein LOC132566179 n=1 Tax=Heteronotia binoei TaxID=13085 RepID=UPI00292D3241|nr:uncharacterized protein LOC132566179 [Heteronotia binoei]